MALPHPEEWSGGNGRENDRGLEAELAHVPFPSAETPMSTVTLEHMQQDQLVMSVARALTLANEAALAQGTEPANSLVTITEERSTAGRLWRVHYGPPDYVSRRGGDLIILVDEHSES